MENANRALRQRVVDQLDFDPSIDASGITVLAADRVISLRGHVPSVMQMAAVERAAWRVKGVRAIEQDIHVRFPEETKLNDDEMAGRAVASLDWHSAIPIGAVRVRVQDGWVTLSGQVPWNYQRTLAESEVRKLSGVAGITNQVTLAPVTPPADMKQRIVGALERHGELAARDITVDVHTDGSVRIGGKVDNWDEREAVEQAVWSAPGVTMVEDALQIA